MSAAGQIDPLMARAQAPVQQSAPQQEQDPLMARAMGQNVAPPAPPVVQHKWNGPAWADPSGYLSSIVRNTMNGATFNMADPAAAAIGAISPILNGNAATEPTYGERYNHLLKLSRSATQQGQQAHPWVSLGAAVAGGMLNPVTNALPAAQTMGGSILQGAGIGGAYGAGGAVGNSKDAGDFLTQTATGAGTGAAFGAATHGLANVLRGATRDPDAQLLADEGVPLTMGQSMGGTAKTLEDASTHIPMLGNAIKGRQADAIKAFNGAAYNRVLEPLGISYDSNAAPIGNDGIDYIGKAIGKAYDQAFDGATVMKSPAVLDGIDTATDEAANLLPKDKVSQIQANINRLVTSKFDENGLLNSQDLATAKNFFAEQSRAGANASLEDRAAAKAYGNVVDALKSGIAETDPQRGDLLNAADSAYMRFVRVSNAASSNAASAKGGIFTPSQLGAALRAADNSVRKGDFARGVAPMQDLAQAGQRVLPSTVPDSGTALRGLLELGAGGAITHEISPSAAIAGAGLIGSGTALYSNPGQSLARALLYGAPASRKAMAAGVQKLLPGALAVIGTANDPSKRGKAP